MARRDPICDRDRDEVRRVIEQVASGGLGVDEATDRLLSDRPLLETSLSRLIRLFQSNTPFAIITAYTSDHTESENRKRNEGLAKRIRELGYGFARTSGLWHEKGKKTPLERGFTVPGMKLDQAIALGREFGQYSIVWGQGNQANWHECETGRPGLKAQWDDFRAYQDPLTTRGGTSPGWKRSPEDLRRAQELGRPVQPTKRSAKKGEVGISFRQGRPSRSPRKPTIEDRRRRLRKPKVNESLSPETVETMRKAMIFQLKGGPRAWSILGLPEAEGLGVCLYEDGDLCFVDEFGERAELRLSDCSHWAPLFDVPPKERPRPKLPG